MLKKKNLLNFFTGFFSEFAVLILGAVIPKLMIVYYGSDVNGLTNTIAQIFTYMALFESGLGTATRMNLYEPIVKDDRESVNKIMSVADRYYKKISIYYGLIVIVLASVLPVLLKTSVDYKTIFLFVFFEGATGFLSFLVTQKWKCIFMASGKNYVINLIEFSGKILCYTLRIILAINGVNIVLIQVGYFIVSIVKILLYRIYIKRNFHWVKLNIRTKENLLKDRKSFFVTEITWVIFSSTDMILIAIFLSTAMSSVYSVYNMVFLALTTLLSSIYNSLNYILGQKYHESIDKYAKTHDFFNSFFMSCITVLMCVAYILIIPFVNLYTDGVTDIEYIYKELPLFFCMVQLLSWSRYIAGNMTGFSGYAKLASKISVAEAIINITFSVVFVNLWGVSGILLGTVMALPLKVIILNYVAEKKVLKRKNGKTVKILIVNYIIFGLTVVLNSFLKLQYASYIQLAMYGAFLTVIYGIVVFSVNSLVNKDLFSETLKQLRKKIVK